MRQILAHAPDITGKTSLVKTALALSLPAMGTMYLIASFNFVDTEFAGRLGAAALAGISTGSFVMWALIGATNLVSIGIGAVIARRIGEGHKEEAERVAYQGILISLVMSVVFAVVIRLISGWIFTDLMKTDVDVIREGMPYLRIMLWGTPVLFLTNTTAQIFQALGDTSRPMRLMLLAFALTLILDYALMLGRLGMPALGVRGAGIAFVVSRVIFSFAALFILCRSSGRGFVAQPHGSVWIDGKLLRQVSWIGLPTFVEGVLFPVIYMILTRYTTAHGTAEVAALRVGHTMEGVTFFGAMGMGIAMRPLVGQNLGAGNVTRAARAPWVGLLLLAGPVLAYSAFLIVAPETAARLMTNDPAVVVTGARYLRIVAWSQIFMTAELIFVGAYSGAGETLIPMAIVLPFTIARWPVAALTQYFGAGIEGVWWTLTATSIVKGILIPYGFSRGHWKKRRV